MASITHISFKSFITIKYSLFCLLFTLGFIKLTSGQDYLNLIDKINVQNEKIKSFNLIEKRFLNKEEIKTIDGIYYRSFFEDTIKLDLEYPINPYFHLKYYINSGLNDSTWFNDQKGWGYYINNNTTYKEIFPFEEKYKNPILFGLNIPQGAKEILLKENAEKWNLSYSINQINYLYIINKENLLIEEMLIDEKINNVQNLLKFEFKLIALSENEAIDKIESNAESQYEDLPFYGMIFYRNRSSNIELYPEQKIEYSPIDFDKIEDVEGKNHVIKEHKLIILDFWFIGCKPCLEAMPKLDQLYKKYQDSGLLVIGINPLDPSKEKIIETTNNLNISYPISQKAYQLIEKYSIRSYPYLLISDSEGNIVYFQTGYRNGDELYLDKVIKELLRNK